MIVNILIIRLNVQKRNFSLNNNKNIQVFFNHWCLAYKLERQTRFTEFWGQNITGFFFLFVFLLFGTFWLHWCGLMFDGSTSVTSFRKITKTFLETVIKIQQRRCWVLCHRPPEYLTSVSFLLTAGSFGNEEGGIRKFTRVEASELKEGQRIVLSFNQRWRAKWVKRGQLRWKQEMPHKSVLVETCEDFVHEGWDWRCTRLAYSHVLPFNFVVIKKNLLQRDGENTFFSSYMVFVSPLMDLKKMCTLGRLVSECHAMVVYVCVCDCI